MPQVAATGDQCQRLTMTTAVRMAVSIITPETAMP